MQISNLYSSQIIVCLPSIILSLEIIIPFFEKRVEVLGELDGSSFADSQSKNGSE